MEPKELALAISHMLENDREALELYVAACEDAQYYPIYPAYSLAYREAKRKDAKRIK